LRGADAPGPAGAAPQGVSPDRAGNNDAADGYWEAIVRPVGG